MITEKGSGTLDGSENATLYAGDELDFVFGSGYDDHFLYIVAEPEYDKEFWRIALPEDESRITIR